MNLARVVINTGQNLGAVVLTSFPGPAANAAVGEVIRHLYHRYADH
jgi:hypothetical protein